MDVPNPVDYFSGHYFRFGFNVQAMCDSHLRFLYVAVAAPGRTNAARVFKHLDKFHSSLRTLGPENFIVGDKAYPIIDKVIIPFSGRAEG